MPLETFHQTFWILTSSIWNRTIWSIICKQIPKCIFRGGLVQVRQSPFLKLVDSKGTNEVRLILSKSFMPDILFTLYLLHVCIYGIFCSKSWFANIWEKVPPRAPQISTGTQFTVIGVRISFCMGQFFNCWNLARWLTSELKEPVSTKGP